MCMWERDRERESEREREGDVFMLRFIFRMEGSVYWKIN